MKLLLRTLKSEGDKGLESSVEVFEGESVVIGRGAGAQIRFGSENVAPAHVLLRVTDEGLLLQDLGSVTGTLVNGRPMQLTLLQVGDTIKVGAHLLEVIREGETWGLQQAIEVHSGDGEDQDSIVPLLARYDVQKQLPSLLALSLFVLCALSAIYFLYPMTSEQRADWSSGPLASAHRHLETSCVSCHSQPFAPVQDKDCLTCHQVKDHTPEFRNVAHHFALGERRCAECHRDHNGAVGILPPTSRLCADCHGNLRAIKGDTIIHEVASWDKHPEFRITTGEPRSKHELGTGGAIDTGNIKLNHAVHLKPGIQGPKGKTTLSCADCHAMGSDRRSPEPVTFEKNCRSCHLLEFDLRYPGVQVPHGDVGAVREFLFAHYSRLFLGEDQKLKTQEPERVKPGRPASAEQYNRATLALINREIESAESLLYTRTGCQLCHEVGVAGKGDSPLPGYDITKPVIPTHWFTNAVFDHTPHLNIECADCHRGVRESKETRDVLLPRVDSCRECHAGREESNRIVSDCSMCHRYHEDSNLHNSTSPH